MRLAEVLPEICHFFLNKQGFSWNSTRNFDMNMNNPSFQYVPFVLSKDLRGGNVNPMKKETNRKVHIEFPAKP